MNFHHFWRISYEKTSIFHREKNQGESLVGFCRTQKLCGAKIHNEMQTTTEWLKEYLNEGQIFGKLPGRKTAPQNGDGDSSDQSEDVHRNKHAVGICICIHIYMYIYIYVYIYMYIYIYVYIYVYIVL